MININYQKKRNTDLFKRFELPTSLFASNTQNYIPIYTRFFNLNETNFNSINLQNKYYITDIIQQDENNDDTFMCNIKNTETNKIKKTNVFFKMAPLLDPYKYMIGKYDISSTKTFELPKLKSTNEDCEAKLLDVNNSAYVDSFFLFLISQLRENFNFIHGVSYYASFLSLKNDFKVNIFDDIDYLNNSDFFMKHKNKLFQVDDYEYLFNDQTPKLQPIKIGHNVSLSSLKSIDNTAFEDIFTEDPVQFGESELCEITNIENMNDVCNKDMSLKSNSTCSSRSSHTHSNEEMDSESETEWESESESESDERGELDDVKSDDDEDLEDLYDEDDDIVIEATLPKFPVQIIAMEKCENTLDYLILKNVLFLDEWQSALMQIIMTLITYQKAFNFTHNDLHTNNIMYINTDEEYIHYVYKKKTYQVPTFGRIYKIIDFGRSIFKFNGKLFCSDSFKQGGDAASQYNIEPYFDDKKPRLEPNPSFDLCRLACSIFDYLVDDFDEIKDINKITDPVKKLIVEWCLDDKGVNLLYKTNGVERYPEFKLYKMISRCVHNHTPHSQLERPEFDKYSKIFDNSKLTDNSIIIDIDSIPAF